MTKAKWFQKLFYNESVKAVKSSLNFLSYESFKNDLIMQLPQESNKSKTRIANNILHRFFPDKKLFTPMAQIWDIYKDDNLLQELFRYEFLVNEPVIAEFLIKFVLNKNPETQIESSIFADYIEEAYGSKNQNLTWWLQGALRDLGFIEKGQSNWIVRSIRVPETAFILLMHRIIMPYPCEVELSTVIDNPFWKYIGIRDEKIVFYLLEKSRLLNLIEFQDQTVKSLYSFDNLLAMKPRLEA